MNGKAILSVDQLSKRFGGIVAVENVTLAIRARQPAMHHRPQRRRQVDLLLAALRHPEPGHAAGSSSRTGRSRRLPAFERVRQGLGLTFQTNRAYHDLSVGQNLEIPMVRRRAAAGAEERYGYALSIFELDEGDPTPVREMPHHKRQWLEMAMVLAGGPEVLLLDEPTAGMSPDETSQTARVLRHLNATGPDRGRGRARHRVRARGRPSG